ncbi:MAG: potassium transporter TrkG [Bacteroidota bacterium]
MALAWALAPLLVALPFWTAGVSATASGATAAYGSPLNALFEAVSALTSTGLTVTTDAGDLPRSLQWWRSLLQWVGGVGVLYLALALVPEAGVASHRAELDAEMGSERALGQRDLVGVWALYTSYTGMTILAFVVTGMPLWEAVNHGMTALATGGFDVTGTSFAAYGPAARTVCAVAMVLGAVSFGVHLAVVVRRRVRVAGADRQVRLGAGLLVAGSLALWASASGVLSLGDAAFQWTSALATAGFSTTSLNAWGPVPMLVLVGAMVVGGSSGSTAGGFKLGRLVALASPEGPRRAALRQLGRVAAALAAGTVLLVVLTEAAPLAALFETASALSTVGLTAGVTGPELEPGGRLVLIGLMWMGRLEIAAAIALLVRGLGPAVPES